MIALGLSLLLTPVAKNIGIRLGALDIPNERKVHTSPIPRTGGLAIFVSFFLTVGLVNSFETGVSDLMVIDRQMVFLLGGGLVAFGIGLFDDFHRLGPKCKFFFQIIGASLAFWGGIRIDYIGLLDYAVQSTIVSYGLTVFWFLLFINAVNLVDGLDGLAGGIVFFASLVMMILQILAQSFLPALFFAMIAGSVLGFLRYNFNPASIFLGDGGSYFLGYTIAGLSILASVKSQVGAATLIPLLALGVPLFDTILSPLRRFVRGQRMFRPDNGHIHHKLIQAGLTSKRAVMIIYGITLVLGILAVFMVNVSDERAGLLLIVLGAGAAIFVRKLGYFEYLASDKFYGWFRDISDQAGFRHDRRSFLNHQIEIAQSANVDELWQKVVNASHFLNIDFIQIKLIDGGTKDFSHCPWCEFTDGRIKPELLDENLAMHVILPLSNRHHMFGSMAIAKDLVRSKLTPFTLRRIEQLRRTVLGTLVKLKENGACLDDYFVQHKHIDGNNRNGADLVSLAKYSYDAEFLEPDGETAGCLTQRRKAAKKA
jgi:UDP-GlcNAc:undecaprenyl-phosphate GlcNAc-1-phosphate transferase